MQKIDNINRQCSEANTRIIYFDILNIISIIAVIALHCNGIVHFNPNSKAWSSSLVIECIFYFAVPMFIMLSGATLMNYREKYDTKNFFRKRISKVLVPFLFWAIVMFILQIITGGMTLEEFSNISDFINAFFSNKESGIYYFMFIILGIYLTMPLLSLLTKNEYRKTLWLTVLLFFIFNATLPNILILFGINYNADLSIQIGSYIVYVLLGYLLSTQKIEKNYRILIYVGAILGILYRYISTYILSKNLGYVVNITWGYTTWHAILLTSAIFIFIKNINLDKKLEGKTKIINILSKISSCSFGIYLIHKIIMEIEIKVLSIDIYSWQWRILGIIPTYLITLIIVYVLKQVPVIRRVVP